MATHSLDIDIDAKIPIIRVDSDDNIIDRDQLDLTSGEKFPIQNGIINSNCNNHNNNAEHKLHLPKPSFRKVPKGRSMRKVHTAKAYHLKKMRAGEGEGKDRYFHYEEPTPEKLDKQVEYDMDLEDMKWLEEFNSTIGKQNNFRVSENDFEKVMDRLEKESYFESVKSGIGTKPDIDVDAVCAICDNGDCNNANAIIFCDMCDLAVHQECYGVPYVPLGQWLCKRCQFSPAQNVECCLCPNLGGAFKQTEITDIALNSDSNGDKKKNKIKIKKGWAHVVCALWVPEVAFANTDFLEPIEGIENIDAARWKLKCYICNQKYKGACIQCSRPNCYVPFHVTCAKQAGLYMRISPCEYEKNGEKFPDVKRSAYCHKHTPAGRKCRGGGMYSGDESDENVDSELYRKKEMVRKKNLKKTRETLAKQLKEFQKEAAIVKVDDKKLLDISKLITTRGKRAYDTPRMTHLKHECVQKIHNYWLNKRASRNGVPLLRRLQVSLNTKLDLQIDSNKDANEYTRFRYDLESCRMLLGEMKKRERFKKNALLMGFDIVKLKLDIIDQEDPATQD